MADNIPVTPGTGVNIATDDILGVHWQKIKIAVGPADAATMVSANTGAVDDGTIRITIGNNDPLMSNLVANTANLVARLPAALSSNGGVKVTILESATTRAGLSGATLDSAGASFPPNMALDRAMFVRSVPFEDIVSGVNTATNNTATVLIAGQGAGIKTYLTGLSVFNGAVDSDTLVVGIYSNTTLMAYVGVKGGENEPIYFPTPLPPSAANATWNVITSANVSTLYFTAIGFKSKI